MLKLRYLWKIQHGVDKNLTHGVYLEIRKNFLAGNEGYIHEVFNLCCKYGRMDLWHGQCPEKVNPLLRIRRIVEQYHLKRDEDAERKVKCIYTQSTTLKAKNYRFDERLTQLGRFHTTEHRSVFLYASLETDKYEKECGNCGEKVMDVTKHGMEECKAVENQRLVYKLRMKLYEASEKTNVLNTNEAFKEAMRKNSMMKVVCEFLIVIWKWNYHEQR